MLKSFLLRENDSYVSDEENIELKISKFLKMQICPTCCIISLCVDLTTIVEDMCIKYVAASKLHFLSNICFFHLDDQLITVL